MTWGILGCNFGGHIAKVIGEQGTCFTYWVIIEAMSPLAIIEGVCVLALFNRSQYVGCYQSFNKIRLTSSHGGPVLSIPSRPLSQKQCSGPFPDISRPRRWTTLTY